jgi:hypothetical protein
MNANQPSTNLNKQIPEMTLHEKIEFGRRICFFPAASVLVFMRRRIGFRLVKPIWIGGTTAFLLLLAGFAANYGESVANTVALSLFAIAGFALAMRERHCRWREMKSATFWHSYSAGISWFEEMRLPPYLKADRRIYRYLDPLACLLVGLVVTFILPLLGLWLMFAGVCLAAFEQATYEKMLERDIDQVDSMLEGEVHADLVDYYKKGQTAGSPPPPPADKLVGIPTGMSPDIKAQIEKRKAKGSALESVA